MGVDRLRASLSILSLAAVLAAVLVAGSSCCDDDVYCWIETQCYWDACCYVCYDVKVCRYYGIAAKTSEISEEIDFDAEAYDAGEGKLDIRVLVVGDRVDGETPVSVRLLGPEVSDLRRQSPKSEWWFRGVPEGAVEAIEVSYPDTGATTRHPVDLGRLAGESPFAGGETPAGEPLPAAAVLAHAVLEAQVVEAQVVGADGGRLRLGDAIPFRAPAAPLPSGAPVPSGVTEIGTAIGYVLETFAPGAVAPRAELVRPGAEAEIRLDLPGRWVIRLVLLAEDASGPSTSDSVALEELAVEVF